MNSRAETLDVLTIVLLALQFLDSVLTVFVTLKFQKKAVPFFLGLLFCGWDILYFVVYLTDNYGVTEFWPLFVLVAGIVLLIAGLYKYKKFKFGFSIPSVTLMGMGLWYMLFSFRIIKTDFLTVVAMLGPAFMLLIAVFLVFFFLAQQKHKELVFKDEDTGIFADEDVPFNKLDE